MNEYVVSIYNPSNNLHLPDQDYGLVLNPDSGRSNAAKDISTTQVIICSTLLHEKEMHSNIGNNDERTGKYGKSNHIGPQCTHVEPECAEDRCTGDFNVKPILMVDQCEIRDFVDDERFEPVVKDRQLACSQHEIPSSLI